MHETEGLSFKANIKKMSQALKTRFFGSREGISLLEVVVALTLLSIVLLSAMAVRMLVRGNEEVNRSQLTGLALLRQAGMDFNSGRTFTGGVIEGKSETGYAYHLTRQLETNISLGYLRMNLEVSIDGDENNKNFGAYASRVFLLPIGDSNTSWWERSLANEPVLEPLVGLYQVKTVSSDEKKGTVDGQGNYPYNSLVKIKANPKPGYQFIQWQGTDVSSPASQETTIYVRDDVEITALFQ